MKDFQWSTREVCAALGVPAEGDDIVFSGISTDTRAIPQGALFVALVGERFDGHDYLGEATRAGAAGAVVSHSPGDVPAALTLFRVEDTRNALGRLARHRRRGFRAPVIGVAGSNGKTTTKDLLRAALGVRFRVHATAGNLNNQVGVPLTLLAAPDDAEAVVVEMGTNEPGEIELLAGIVEPDVGVLTSIGEEHLEKLGDLEGVLREELALLPGIRGEGPVFLADEPPALPAAALALLPAARVRTAGFAPTADLHPEGSADGVVVAEDGSTRWRWEGADVHLPLPGLHNVRNALLALGVARELGLPPAEAARGISTVARPRLRGEWHRVGEMRVLADCYNANPPGMLAALQLLASLPGEGPKVAVLGTMRELGAHTEALHRKVADQAAGYLGKGIDRIVATGAFAATDWPTGLDGGARLLREADPALAYTLAALTLRGDETVLLKASRGETLERWLELLAGDFGG